MTSAPVTAFWAPTTAKPSARNRCGLACRSTAGRRRSFWGNCSASFPSPPVEEGGRAKLGRMSLIRRRLQTHKPLQRVASGLPNVLRPVVEILHVASQDFQARLECPLGLRLEIRFAICRPSIVVMDLVRNQVIGELHRRLAVDDTALHASDE